MATIISLHDQSNTHQVILSNTDVTIVGRGFLECNDKRVSKQHGELTVQDKCLKVKSCGVNPIFYKHKDQQIQRLMMGSEVILQNSDMFSLLPLPNDFEWTIKVEVSQSDMQPNSTTFRIRDISEINDRLETGDMAVSYSQVLREGSITPDLELQTDNSGARPRKRSLEADTGDTNAMEAKKLKPLDLEVPTSSTDVASNQSCEVSQTTSEKCDAVISSASIKSDPDSTNSQIVQQTPSNSAVNVKEEPIEPSCSQSEIKSEPVEPEKTKSEPNENPTVNQPAAEAEQNSRPSCEFGIRCFRSQGDHQRDFAHPRDSDYRRPDYPNAPPEAPRCPYWESCYRRNPDHFREFQHPPSNAYNPVQPQIPRIVGQPQVFVVPFIDDDDDYESEFEESDYDDSDVDRDYEIDVELSQSQDDLGDEENNLEE